MEPTSCCCCMENANSCFCSSREFWILHITSFASSVAVARNCKVAQHIQLERSNNLLTFLASLNSHHYDSLILSIGNNVSWLTFSAANVCDKTLDCMCSISEEALIFNVWARSFRVPTPELYISLIFLILDSRSWAAWRKIFSNR